MQNEYIRVFRALTDVNRVRVLEILSHGEQCACVLLDALAISQPTLSHHMKILCDSGIVKCQRVGKWNYYSIHVDGCEYASRLLTAIVNHKMDDFLHLMQAMHRFLHSLRTFLGWQTPPKKMIQCLCCDALHDVKF
ncbi:MAG: metalloregulator ArsR/SmtB family transcription factor [Clostridia bacterium]